MGLACTAIGTGMIYVPAGVILTGVFTTAIAYVMITCGGKEK